MADHSEGGRGGALPDPMVGWLMASGVLFVWFVSVPIASLWVAHQDNLSATALYGDSFGAVNALFSALGLAAVAWTLLLQTRELALQREATARQEEATARREEATIRREAALAKELDRQRRELELLEERARYQGETVVTVLPHSEGPDVVVCNIGDGVAVDVRVCWANEDDGVTCYHVAMAPPGSETKIMSLAGVPPLVSIEYRTVAGGWTRSWYRSFGCVDLARVSGPLTAAEWRELAPEVRKRNFMRADPS